MIKKGFSFVAILAVLAMLGATAGNALAGGLVDTSNDAFSEADFSNPTTIDNPWWTMPEDSNSLYFAEDGDDCVWNLVQVLGTSMIPENNGIVAPYAGTEVRIVLDRGWVDEECAYGDDFQAFMNEADPEPEEVTYDWYAQDEAKNIWYMGENSYEEDYGGSFTAGCLGAEAGIVILGEPFKGAFYAQEFYEGEAEDWGKVLNFKNMGDLVCMKTKEWTPLERGAVEHKRYCSDGTFGELDRIDELHGKTLIVELVDTDVVAPPVNGLPINPEPQCPPYSGK
jgi:hypothetical protein